MGLDQYAYARKGLPETDFGSPRVEKVSVIHKDQLELAYWRKHPNLQGWMEELWKSKGGEGQFNCVDVELTLDDLNRLEEAIDGEELPETRGFYFGTDSDDFYREGDLQFISEAREHIEIGYKIVYTSWW